MLTISKPLSASQVRTYHEREFASERQNYWSRDQQGHSEWQGKLDEQWGLEGAVGNEHFARLTEGQPPYTEAQLVRHQASKTYEGKFGKEVTSVEHRAGWDATFSAPKSVSLTALVGGDECVREAHRESVRVALTELEKYTQARIGNVHASETTGKFVAAIRKNIWRPAARAGSRLKTICVRWESTGPEPRKVAAHRTRDSKELLSPGEVLERHRELGAQYGHQADRVVAEARERGQRHVHSPVRSVCTKSRSLWC
jgi:hypothetical protein